MPVRSDKLFLGTVTPAAPAGGVLFTVPTGRTTIVKSVNVYMRGSTSGPLRLLVRSGGSSIGMARWEALSPAFVHWAVWWVLDAGDQILADGTQDVGWWVLISGSTLFGPTA